MKSRRQLFIGLKDHPWLSRTWIKMTKKETEFCIEFCDKHENVTRDEFELKLNRLFLDDKNKTKNWKIILEILSCVNSAHTLQARSKI